MKIVFLCGCLEPDFDGVGDYTRILASQLISQGIDAMIISLNDNYVVDQYEGQQVVNAITIPVVRLPAGRSLKDRLFKAKMWIDQFDPDWLSLQFVIYSYHPKGTPFALGPKL